MQNQNRPDFLASELPIEHSADWRFLLPLSENSKGIIVGRELGDVAQFFNTLKFSAQAMDFPEFEQELRNASANFDFIALPLGFPDSFSDRVVEALAAASRLLRPKGRILLAFSNRYTLWEAAPAQKYLSTPMQIQKTLKQAGYCEIVLYAALSNLTLPEYIFPLNRQAATFALDHRYRHKLPFKARNSRIIAFLAPFLLNFFPFYFATASPKNLPPKRRL